MGIFVFAGLFVLLALLVLLRPLFRSPNTAQNEDRESRIYQDQLKEVERDLARGVLTDDQAKSARNEIERRLLLALRRQGTSSTTVSKLGRLATAIGIAAMPIAAGALYIYLGSPNLPQAPFDGRDRMTEAVEAAPGTHAEMRARIVALEERLSATPDDLEGQALLARSYASIGEYDQALNAYLEANRLANGTDVRLAGEYAEVMVLANDGIVPVEALNIYRNILADFPSNPQATYYVALADSQAGNTTDALARLNTLRAEAPEGAPWLATVDALVNELGGTASAAVPSPSKGPTAEQIQAAAAMSPEEREAMVRSMVEGLATKLEANPDDLEGWRRLARAYDVIGEKENATRAYTEVLKRAPNDPAANAYLNP